MSFWTPTDAQVAKAEVRIGEAMASAYLAAGKVEQAREHFTQLFRLFPSEENHRLLMAIEKRIAEEKPQPGGASNGSQPIPPETDGTSSAAGRRH